MIAPVGHYLVTGCAGFVGSHLVDSVLARGDSVIGVDSFTDYYERQTKEANVAEARESSTFELVEADLGTATLDHLFQGVDGVFHLAARPGVRESWGESFDVYVRDNVVASQRVFEAAARTGVRVVFASSSSVYGDAEQHPTTEEAPFRPRSPYGVTKVAAEQLAAAYGRTLDLDAVALRLFTIFGPRQRPDMAVSRILTALLQGLPFRVFGSGTQSRDFTFIEDAVAAALVAMERAPHGAVYNVGGGSEISLSEVIALAEALADARLDTLVEAEANGDVRRTAADTGRIRSDLGWSPTTSFEEGLQRQLNWTAALVSPFGQAVP
jgi:UDP-glucuronate 4-epimerase